MIKINLKYLFFIFQTFFLHCAYASAFCPHNQSCSGGESLSTYERFDRLGIWTPYLLHQKRTSYLSGRFWKN